MSCCRRRMSGKSGYAVWFARIGRRRCGSTDRAWTCRTACGNPTVRHDRPSVVPTFLRNPLQFLTLISRTAEVGLAGTSAGGICSERGERNSLMR